jgi:hypothetical protein
MYPAELRWLHEQAAAWRYVVEIGVYQARSTVALAYGVPAGGRVVGIDSWEGGPAERDEWHPEFATAQGRDAVYMAALRNTATLPVQLIRLSSHLAHQVISPKIGLLFHDGAHDYDSLLRDLHDYVPLVEGRVCGHDYCAAWPGVIRAVDEFFGPRVRRGPGSLWYAE